MGSEVADVGREEGGALSSSQPPAAHTPAAGPAGSVAPASRCPSCGEALVGDFCHRCGEKRVESRDLTIRHFISEAAQELTSVEHSKLFRTVRALLFRPGFLTLEWVAGRRSRYLKPLNLCLGIFALNLFVYSVYKEVSMFDIGRVVAQEQPMARQMAEQWKLPQRPGGPLLTKMADQTAARRGMTREAVFAEINEKWHRNFSLLQIPEILFFAILLQIVYLFAGRYFVEHLVFSLHFLAFTSLTVVLMWPVYFVLGIEPTPLAMFAAVAKFLLDIFYLFMAARAVYKESAVLAVIRAFVLFAGYFVIYSTMYVIAMFAATFSVFRA